jgi:F420H(2)-dependent quinone reductase
VLMTYRGAKTGKVRNTPVLRVAHEGRYAAVASNGGAPTNPRWYASLVAEPVIELQEGAVTREYRVREVVGHEKARRWRRAVDAYPDYAGYQRKTDRQIPVLVLEPVSRGAPAQWHAEPVAAAIDGVCASGSSPSSPGKATFRVFGSRSRDVR